MDALGDSTEHEVSDGDPFSESEKETYESQLEALDEKDILLEIMVELKAIRYELSQQERRPNAKIREPESESETQSAYECRTCHKTVVEGDRENHLVDKHNYPAELPIDGEFTEL